MPPGPANGPLPRTGSPRSGTSTLITSAPNLARFMLKYGPAKKTVTPRTRMSSKGCIFTLESIDMLVKILKWSITWVALTVYRV